MNILLEFNQAFQTESVMYTCQTMSVERRMKVDSLRHEHRQTVPERPDNECVFRSSRSAFSSLETPSFQGQADIELYTGTTSHLGKSVTSVDN